MLGGAQKALRHFRVPESWRGVVSSAVCYSTAAQESELLTEHLNQSGLKYSGIQLSFFPPFSLVHMPSKAAAHHRVCAGPAAGDVDAHGRRLRGTICLKELAHTIRVPLLQHAHQHVDGPARPKSEGWVWQVFYAQSESSSFAQTAGQARKE
eukprot:1159045-Pelagomonas_calceolata.AAC.9